MSASASAFPHAATLIEQGLEDGLHLGAQLYVSVEGQVIAEEAFGDEQPDHPMTTETAMLWMSSVKPVTSIAIGQLWQKGLLDLDEPVATVIPEFSKNGKDAITPRHILTHTGGFRTADSEWHDEAWEAALERIYAAPLEKDWIPGQKAGYHTDGSWYVLGEIIRRMTQRPYPEVIQEDVFEALNISDAWLAIPEDRVEDESLMIGDMYVWKNGELIPHPFANSQAACMHVRPGGNGRGPVRALGRIYEDLLAGWLRDESRLLSQETIRAMTAREREGLLDETFRHKMDWGLGFMVNSNRYGPDTVPYGFGKRASESAFGHSGAQSSVGMADPEHELVVALAFNGMPGEPRHQRRIRPIMTALYEDLGLR